MSTIHSQRSADRQRSAGRLVAALGIALVVVTAATLGGCASSDSMSTSAPASAGSTAPGTGSSAPATATSLPTTGSTGSQGAPGKVVKTTSGKATYRDVTPAELATMLEHKNFPLINVHVPYEGEIKGTDLFLPYTEAAAKIGELPKDKNAPVVAYCRSGRMSAIAADVWADAGYTDVYNLKGGFRAWEAQGYPLLHLNR
jgi:rhodanese-related sulfurtransferase